MERYKRLSSTRLGLLAPNSSPRSVLGPKRLIYFFMNNIFNLKRNCVLRTLKNSFAIIFERDGHTYNTYTHNITHKGRLTPLKKGPTPKCKPLGNFFHIFAVGARRSDESMLW